MLIRRQAEPAGSSKSFTRNEAHFDYGPADWYPEDHPVMPDIVARGRQADGIRACGLCHYPNGQGKMENGGVAGLPAAYILQQLADFKSGARKSADPRKANTNEMAAIARTLTEPKRRRPPITSRRCRGEVGQGRRKRAGAARARHDQRSVSACRRSAPEPLGQRIIEMPEQPESTELSRDPRSGSWRTCRLAPSRRARRSSPRRRRRLRAAPVHGADLKGSAPCRASPPVAELHRAAAARHAAARARPTMKAAVAKLTVEDIVNITAYVLARRDERSRL